MASDARMGKVAFKFMCVSVLSNTRRIKQLSLGARKKMDDQR
jgi:hypothetical protein